MKGVLQCCIHFNAYPFHTVAIQRTRGKKNKQKTTSISHSILWLSDCSNRKLSARQEVTCTYLHHTTPLFFLSPTLLSFQRQATHGPDRTREAAAEHCHLPDTGDNKSQPRGWLATLPRPEQRRTCCAGHVWKTYCYTSSATKGHFGKTVQIPLLAIEECVPLPRLCPWNVYLFIYTLLGQVLVSDQGCTVSSFKFISFTPSLTQFLSSTVAVT